MLRPACAEDIAALVRFCRRHEIPISARGQGHTTFGQGLVDGGVVVDMSCLREIHRIGDDYAQVDAGLTWKALVAATVPRGLTPPVLTGYLGLSIGGTLSVGGVSTRPNLGAQVDHVRALQVVTGRGEMVWCSEEEHADLFEGVLAGLGQLGIITRAVVELVPAPARVRSWTLMYRDPSKWFADLQRLLARGEFESIYGSIAPIGAPTSLPPPPAWLVRGLAPLAPVVQWCARRLGFALRWGSRLVSALPSAWVYQINVAKFYTTTPPSRALVDSAPNAAWLRYRTDVTYADFALRVDVLVELLETLGQWRGVQHPWFDAFLDGEHTRDFVTRTVSDLRFRDVGLGGLILLFPLARAALSRSNLRIASGDSEYVFLFDILTAGAAPGNDARWLQQMLTRNRRLYLEAAACGGTLYPIGSTPMEPSDWRTQYGPTWAGTQRRKRTYDPDGVLTPGPDMFRGIAEAASRSSEQPKRKAKM